MQDLKKKIELQPLQEKNRESTEQKNGGGARSTWLEKKKLGQKNEEKKRRGCSVGPRGWRKNRGKPKEKGVIWFGTIAIFESWRYTITIHLF
jgi:hypothetical protein